MGGIYRGLVDIIDHSIYELIHRTDPRESTRCSFYRHRNLHITPISLAVNILGLSYLLMASSHLFSRGSVVTILSSSVCRQEPVFSNT